MHPHRAKAKAMHSAKIKGYATGGRVGGSDISEPKVKMMKGEEGKGYASGGMVMGMKAPRKMHKAKKPGTHINIINMPHGGAGAPAGPPPGVGMIPPPVRPVAPAPMPGPMGMPPPGVGPAMGPGMMRKNGGRVAFKKGGRVHKAEGGEVANTVASNMRKAVNKIEDVDQKRGAMNKAMAKPLDDESSLPSGAIGNHTLNSDRKRGGKVAHKATGGRVSKPTMTAKPYGGPDKVSKADPMCKPDRGEYTAGACTGEGREEKIKNYGREAGKPAKSSSTS